MQLGNRESRLQLCKRESSCVVESSWVIERGHRESRLTCSWVIERVGTAGIFMCVSRIDIYMRVTHACIYQ